MSDGLERLAGALADRYRIEGELGPGGMARERAAEAAARLLSLTRCHLPSHETR